MKKIIVLSISAFFLVLPIIFNPPSGLSPEGFKTVCIFFTCALWWITNVVPLMITSVFAMAMLSIYKVSSPSEIFSKFGSSAIFFVLGSLILASAFMRSGLSTRFALKMLEKLGKSAVGLVMGVYFISSILSIFISSHAVAALMFPIVMEMTFLLNDERMSKTLFLSMIWGAVLSSSLTFLGGARAVLAVELMREATGKYLSFLEWVERAFPVVVTELVLGALILWYISSKINVPIDAVRRDVKEKLSSMGKVTSREKLVSLVFALAVIGWMIFGKSFGLASVSLIVVLFLFLLNLVRWQEVEEDVNWGIILMYGGAIALGRVMSETGVSNWIIGFFEKFIKSPGMFLVFLVIIVVILTEFMSNSAVVAFILPMALSAQTKYGIPAEVITLSVTIPSGLALMMPMSTPAVAMAISSGKIDVKDTVKYGWILSVSGAFLTILMAKYVWR